MATLVNMFETNRGIVEGIIVIVVIALVALGVNWLVFRPYYEMIRASLRRPLPQILKADAYELKGLIADFLEEAKRDDPSTNALDGFFVALSASLDALEKAKCVQDRSYASLHSGKDDYRRERAAVFTQAFQIDRLRAVVSDLGKSGGAGTTQLENLLSRLERLSTAPNRAI